MRYIITLVIALLAAQAYTYSLAADARAENAVLRREMANIKGTIYDQAQTIQHLTHPATMHRRTIDWLYGQGEFKEPQR
jgi:hypothetical protein